MEKHFIDIHCHGLYDVDDGPKTLEQSLKMLQEAYDENIRKIIYTFHSSSKASGHTLSRAGKHLEVVKTEAAKHWLDMEFYLGSEILAGGNIVEALREERITTLNNTRYLLIEFYPNDTMDRIYESLRVLINHGYVPIVAHIEVYDIFNKTENVKQLIDLGALIQANSGHFKGGMLDKRAKKLVKMLEEGLIHFVADDAHNTAERAHNMKTTYNYLLNKRKIPEEVLNKVFFENQEAVINDERVRK